MPVKGQELIDKSGKQIYNFYLNVFQFFRFEFHQEGTNQELFPRQTILFLIILWCVEFIND